MIAFDLPWWLVSPYLFLMGAVIGSFLNVCIYRIPQQTELWRSLRGVWDPPSSCPRCRTRIRWFDNIPVFAWLWLGGRCRTCRMRISFRYPLIEGINGLLWVALYWLEVPLGFGASFSESGLYTPLGPAGVPGSDWLSPEAVLHWRFAYHLVLCEALLVASCIDLDHWIIPDGVTVPAMIIGFLVGWGTGQVYLVPVWFQSERLAQDLEIARRLVPEFQVLLPQWLDLLVASGDQPGWIDTHRHVHGLAVSLAGFVVGGGVVWAVRIIGSWVLRREAMGFGDVVLMAMIGSFLGWQPTLIVFFLAPACALCVVLASLVVHRPREIPYGPYLSVATLAVLFGWRWIWPMAEQKVFQFGPLVILLGGGMLVSLFVTLLLLQGVKWCLGMELYPAAPPGVWTAADQHQFLAGERVDAEQGLWRRSGWPGILSGRGQSQEHRWRHASRDGRA